MFEAIYISPSRKQAVEFIDLLFWDLAKHKVYDIEKDPTNLQLKSVRFIVSAIYIGMLPRQSFCGVKYYIAGFDIIPLNFSLGRLYEWAEHIKRRFSLGTKKISEEELVEILTEASV